MIDLVWLFQKRSFVLSSEHENQNVASIGTLLDQFMLSCKEEHLSKIIASIGTLLDQFMLSCKEEHLSKIGSKP